MNTYKLILSLLLCSSSLYACDSKEDTNEVEAGEMAGTNEVEAGEMAGTNEVEAGEMAGTNEVEAGEMMAGEVEAGEMNPESMMEEMDAMAQRAFDWLTGRFDSSAQSRTQPAYYAIQLTACKVNAPELGEHVLYIEQAQVSAADEPYRQRLYHVEAVLAEDGQVEVISSVYNVNNPDSLVGLCDRLETMDFTLADVTLREGCAVHLNWQEDHFEGGTRGTECSSTLGGASYATSEVYMNDSEIRSWDRGFDSNDQQVWGATDGAYEFIRQE